jgi:hypothetical protein
MMADRPEVFTIPHFVRKFQGAACEAFRALIAREIPQWREVGQAAKITLE